jgi:hypothetical protein
MIERRSLRSDLRLAVEQGKDRRVPAISLAEPEEHDAGKLAHQLKSDDPLVELAHDREVIHTQRDFAEGSDRWRHVYRSETIPPGWWLLTEH